MNTNASLIVVQKLNQIAALKAEIAPVLAQIEALSAEVKATAERYGGVYASSDLTPSGKVLRVSAASSTSNDFKGLKEYALVELGADPQRVAAFTVTKTGSYRISEVNPPKK